MEASVGCEGEAGVLGGEDAVSLGATEGAGDGGARSMTGCSTVTPECGSKVCAPGAPEFSEVGGGVITDAPDAPEFSDAPGSSVGTGVGAGGGTQEEEQSLRQLLGGSKANSR